MEIAIIDAEHMHAVYFDGQIKYQSPTSHDSLKKITFADLKVKDILEKIISHSKEFEVSPTVDNLEYFYLEFDEQFDTLDNADYVFPDLLHEAIKLYGLE